MTDFSVLKVQANTGTSDAAPTWSDILFGTPNYELRFCGTGAGGAAIASASWPPFLRPLSASVIPECWAYVGSDNSGGLKVTTYDGGSAHYAQFRLSWDSTGTFASGPIVSAWKDATLPAASPGTQPTNGDGSSIINGQVIDTNNTSYLKANAYGYGVDAAGVQQTPSANAGGTLTATSGVAGAASPATGAWLATFQSLQAGTQYVQDAVTPKATTAGFWYLLLALYSGPNCTGGTLVPVWGISYTWV